MQAADVSPGGPLIGRAVVVAVAEAGVAVVEGEVAVGAPAGGPMALQAPLLLTPPERPPQPVLRLTQQEM